MQLRKSNPDKLEVTAPQRARGKGQSGKDMTAPSRSTYQDWNRLWQALELESGDDLVTWIGSDLFAPYFLELYESVIKPAQEEAATQGGQRSHGPKLRCRTRPE